MRTHSETIAITLHRRGTYARIHLEHWTDEGNDVVCFKGPLHRVSTFDALVEVLVDLASNAQDSVDLDGPFS